MAKKTNDVRKLTSGQQTVIVRIKSEAPDFKQQGKLGEFFDLFLVCEATAKKLINYAGYNDYNITNIQRAMSMYFPNESSDFLNNIFLGGDGNKRNHKSCRQLRNGYIHSLSKQDRQEIENRIDVLRNNMNRWINLFN
jgi:hypothetical protein